MAFSLPDLPYPANAFGQTISEETFRFHHGKHHGGYVEKTNELAAEAGMQDRRLSQVIRDAHDQGLTNLFNNAAQVWNHSFFWQCLSPEQKTPSGRLKELIESSFGSLGEMLKALQHECENHFASGWGWLVLEEDRLKVTSLHDADTPIVHQLVPLLTIDVWEHAYYIDYRNARPTYLDRVLTDAIDWDFVTGNLDGTGVNRADQ